MHLTQFSDYSLRVVIYLGCRSGEWVSADEISRAYRISRHHLVRVMQTLQTKSFIKISAGRGGGAVLARDPSQINLGEVVRQTERSFRIVECFDAKKNKCPIVPVCGLRGILGRALDSFFHVLDGYTLADLVRMKKGRKLAQFLHIEALHAAG